MKSISFIFSLAFFLFFLLAPQSFAATLFSDDFHGTNGDSLSTHNSHWSSTSALGTSPTVDQYEIQSNTAQSGSTELYDVNKLDVTLPSHFLVEEEFTFSSSISSDPNQAFMDIRINDSTDTNSNTIRFYPTATGTKVDAFLANSSVESSSTGTFNTTGNNIISVENNAGSYIIKINDTSVLTFTESSFTVDHIIISQHINTGVLSNFILSDFVEPEAKIVAFPSSSVEIVGVPFNVDIKIDESNVNAFNAARANVAVSSNLSITGIHAPTSNACNLQYTQTPATSNPSFAGAIYGGSSTSCTLYILTLTPTSTGTGTVTFTNGSIKSYTDNSEILTFVENGSFTINDGSTPTPTPQLEFQITNPLQTYKTNFDLTGTKLSSITHIFVNGDDGDSTYPTSTTWSVPVTLTLGANNFTLYGSDDEENQTATQTITVNRHTLGDINGDGNVDLIDASLFAVDWDKTSGLTYNLSDMNDDGVVDLTDLSILAKLIE